MIKENITVNIGGSYDLDGEIIAPSQVMTSNPQEESGDLTKTPNFVLKLVDEEKKISVNTYADVEFTLGDKTYTANMKAYNRDGNTIALQYVDGLTAEDAPTARFIYYGADENNPMNIDINLSDISGDDNMFEIHFDVEGYENGEWGYDYANADTWEPSLNENYANTSEDFPIMLSNRNDFEFAPLDDIDGEGNAIWMNGPTEEGTYLKSYTYRFKYNKTLSKLTDEATGETIDDPIAQSLDGQTITFWVNYNVIAAEPEPVEPHFLSPEDDTLITGTIDSETGEFRYPIEVVGSDGNNIAYDILADHVTCDDYEHVAIGSTPGYDEETESETVAGVYLAIWEAGSGQATLTFNDGTQSCNTTFAYEVTGSVEPEPEPEYEILDYIYPTENHTYIETGVQNSADISFEMQYNMINITEYGRLVGSSASVYYEKDTIIVDYEGGSLTYKWFGETSMIGTGTANDYDVHKINYSPLEFYVDDTLIRSRESVGSGDGRTTSLRFFNGWSNYDGSSAPGDQGYFNLYYAKIYDNGTLVRDYVPVKRLSDNKYGLYDNVNGVFYGSANEGQWASQDVSATEFSGQSKAEPEYIYPNT